MKKTIITLAMITLLTITIVIAENDNQPIPVSTNLWQNNNWEDLNGLYKYRCEIIRPATEYRQEKSYGFIGIFGRYSDGSIKCFIPGNNKHKETNINKETPKDECKEITTCTKECKTEKVKTKCGWKWEETCKNICKTKTIC